MNKKMKSIIVTILGLLMLCAGMISVKRGLADQGILHLVSYLGVGLGCGIFGHGMSELLKYFAFKNHPEDERKIQIEINDERNVTIANKSKAKAYDMMIFVFGALIFTLALMGVDISTLLLIVVAYLFVTFYGIYYRCKFDKEM